MIIRNVPYRKELAASSSGQPRVRRKAVLEKVAAAAIDSASFFVQQDRRRIDVMVES